MQRRNIPCLQASTTYRSTQTLLYGLSMSFVCINKVPHSVSYMRRVSGPGKLPGYIIRRGWALQDGFNTLSLPNSVHIFPEGLVYRGSFLFLYLRWRVAPRHYLIVWSFWRTRPCFFFVVPGIWIDILLYLCFPRLFKP